jgi:hypothetical protein
MTKFSRKTTITISIAAGVVAILFISMNISAFAGPAFVNSTLYVVRDPDKSQIVQDPTLRAKFMQLPSSVLDQNPELKEAMSAADANYQKELPYMDKEYIVSENGANVPITEQQANQLLSQLTLIDQGQHVSGGGIISHNAALVQVDGKFYHIIIVQAGS